MGILAASAAASCGHRREPPYREARLPGELWRSRHPLPVRHRSRLLSSRLRDHLPQQQHHAGSAGLHRGGTGAEPVGDATPEGPGDAAGGVDVLQLRRRRHGVHGRRNKLQQGERVQHLQHPIRASRPATPAPQRTPAPAHSHSSSRSSSPNSQPPFPQAMGETSPKDPNLLREAAGR